MEDFLADVGLQRDEHRMVGQLAEEVRKEPLVLGQS